MLHQGLLPDVIIYNAWLSACEKGHATAERITALRANAASRPPARRHHLQRLDQCLHKARLRHGTSAAAESFAAIPGYAASETDKLLFRALDPPAEQMRVWGGGSFIQCAANAL